MQSPNEDEAIAGVAAKLAERFPTVPASEIESIVTEEHRKFDGRPVRAYVAVLVEQAAKRRLLQPAQLAS
jgi:hypothetical protein